VPGWSLSALYIGDRLPAADLVPVLAAFARLDAVVRER
jgi:hypothetical protein